MQNLQGKTRLYAKTPLFFPCADVAGRCMVPCMTKRPSLDTSLTPAALRAALGIVGRTRSWLSQETGLAPDTVTGVLNATRRPEYDTLVRMESALAASGVVFLPPQEGEGVGVRLKLPEPLPAYSTLGRPRKAKHGGAQ